MEFKATTLHNMLVAAALLAATGMANAQYVWVDEKGIKQFSDRSPPASIPDKNILKAPGRKGLAPATADETTEGATPAAAAAQAAPPTVAERNMDFNKRAAEKAERERKAANEAKVKAAVAENCDAARASKLQLESGIRLGSATAAGGYMGDAERKAAIAKTSKVLATCK